MVDNVEDVDTVVGFLAEPTRPHGFGISETQFVVFILNASRRLFTDRFLTSSYRPEFYTTLGIDWVNNNGPTPMFESAPVNGHEHQPVSPLKRVLMRMIPELAPELEQVRNAFDPGRATGASITASPGSRGRAQSLTRLLQSRNTTPDSASKERRTTMEIAPGIYSMGQEEGGHVHAFLLDDGAGLTLIDTLCDDDGKGVLAELSRIGRTAADVKNIILTHAH
mgnify:CR=1 FL=1